MIPIPNFLKPHEDELFYSYICRLAKANACEDIRYFIGKYFIDETNLRKINNIYWNYDGRCLFSQFLNTDIINSHMYITNHSLYPFHALFLTTHRQSLVLDSLFNTKHIKRPTKFINLITELHYCKDCMENDYKNYGHDYIHRSHQLPGVTVCHKHHTPLLRCENNTPLDSTTDAVDYAEFSSALLQANLQADISQLQEAVQKHTIHTRISKSFNKGKIPEIIRILMRTFKNVESLASCLPQEQNNNTILKFVAAVSNEYDVYEPFNINIIKMRHKSCGTEFYTTPAGFLAGWKCPFCFSRTDIPTASFKNAISALVGNEYTVLSDYKGQHQAVEIRHNLCGNIHAYQPNDFLRGRRCPQCTTIIANEAVPDMVSYITNGQYKVTHRHNRNLYEITEAGGQTVELTKEHFLQEIRRPTPSDVLPVPIKNLRDNWKQEMWMPELKHANISKNDLLDKIYSIYNDDDLIFREDLLKILGDKFKAVLTSNIRKLIADKKLFRIEPGIYTLTPQIVQSERLFREKYLVRNGHRIGFPDSHSLAYKIGLTKDKPDGIYIMTNAESDQSHRTLTINGYKVRLQGNKIIINDDNYQYLMVFEALKYCWHYGFQNIDKIPMFIKKNNLQLNGFLPLLPAYSNNINKQFRKIWRKAS